MNGRQFIEWLHQSEPRPLVMGILNLTPDSFSDGGDFLDPAKAAGHAAELIAEGADLLDLGAESTRPGARRIPAEGQIARLTPVIERIRRSSDIAISIDTTLSEVGRSCMEEGANILNDISAGGEDADMFILAAQHGLPLILMHMQGEPATMQQNPTYQNVTREVAEFLRERAALARAAGVPASHILLDPGIGFGKTAEHNLTLLKNLPALQSLGHRLLLGVSRKRFIGSITGVQEPKARLHGSVAAAAWCVSNGAAIVRVHDVRPTVEALQVIRAIQHAPAPD